MVGSGVAARHHYQVQRRVVGYKLQMLDNCISDIMTKCSAGITIYQISKAKSEMKAMRKSRCQSLDHQISCTSDCA